VCYRVQLEQSDRCPKAFASWLFKDFREKPGDFPVSIIITQLYYSTIKGINAGIGGNAVKQADISWWVVDVGIDTTA
jgi:hypothetical protein